MKSLLVLVIMMAAVGATVETLKKEMRNKIGNEVKALRWEEVRRQSEVVTQRVLNAAWFERAERLSVYVHYMGEVTADNEMWIEEKLIETETIILTALKQGKAVFIPHFKKGETEMKMLRLDSKEDYKSLKPYMWGIKQHASADGIEEYSAGGPLDLILCPGVAFTEAGARLGHGMGYYDRFLRGHNEKFGRKPHAVGLALQEQIVKQIPTATTDVAMNEIVWPNPQ